MDTEYHIALKLGQTHPHQHCMSQKMELHFTECGMVWKKEQGRIDVIFKM